MTTRGRFGWLVIAAAMLTGCAVASGGANEPLPLWRTDVTWLESDKQAIRSCLQEHAQDLDQCVPIVQQRCPANRMTAAEDPAADEMQGRSATGGRRCDWRAIAAWEDVMAEILAQLNTVSAEQVLAASQSAWEASMLADVRFASSAFEGGTWEGPRAAAARAEATARRAIWLQEELRRRREGER